MRRRAASSSIKPTVKHGGGSVMVLGAFLNCKVGSLHKVRSKLNQKGYQSIFQYHAIPFGTRHVRQGFVLMQDNDPKPYSKLWQKNIKKKAEQHVFQLMCWPVESAKLNPIKLVWNKLDQKVRAKQRTIEAHLWQFMQESWTELSLVFLHSLAGCLVGWLFVFVLWHINLSWLFNDKPIFIQTISSISNNSV